MKKQTNMRCLAFILVFLVAATAVPLIGGKADVSYAAASRLKAPRQVKAVSEDAHSVKLSWKKVKKAEGYFIYRYEKGSKKYVKIKKLSAKKKRWINRGLNTDQVYRYKVRAYRTAAGKYQTGRASYVVSVKPQTKKSGKKNVRRVYMRKRIDGLYPGYRMEMEAYTDPWRNTVSKKLVWESSNPNIVKASKSGVLTAVRTGTAHVTARAHNGTQAVCRVKVIDYKAEINGKSVSLGEKVSSLNRKFGKPYTGSITDSLIGKLMEDWGVTDKRIKVHVYGSSAGELTVIAQKGRVIGFASTDEASFNLMGIKNGEPKGSQLEQRLKKRWPDLEYYDESSEGGLDYYEGYGDGYITELLVDVTGGHVRGIAVGGETMMADLAYTLIFM